MFEARPKSFHSRPLYVSDGCVHFADHTPSVSAVLGRSDWHAQSAATAPRGPAFHIYARTTSARPAPSLSSHAAGESADATRNVQSTRPHRADWRTSASDGGVSSKPSRPRGQAVFGPTATPRRAPRRPVSPHGSGR